MKERSGLSGRSSFQREQIKKRNALAGRGEMNPSPRRPSLRDEIASLDQDILRLLLKRYNLAAKIRQNGRMSSADEKFLREKWQASVARISRDPELSNHFFALLQDLSFLPRADGADSQIGSGRQAFSLFPAKKKLDFTLAAPLDTILSCSWAYLAASSGQSLKISPAPDNVPSRDCLNGFTQMGASLKRENGIVEIQGGQPMGRPDRILYAGESEFNFFLFMAHYLGRASRVKITGEKRLKLVDYTALNHFLPQLGARMVHVVPKSSSLPVRLECSGLLPPGIKASPDLPSMFLEALLLASPFYEKPFTIDFGEYPERDTVFSRTLPLLEQAGVIFAMDGSSVGVNPSPIKLPPIPAIPMDPELGCFFLALAAACGGTAKLEGSWPKGEDNELVLKTLNLCGQKIQLSQDAISLESNTPLDNFNFPQVPQASTGKLPPWIRIFLTCLAACATLRKGSAKLPDWLRGGGESEDFLRACGLEASEDGELRQLEKNSNTVIWNAPDGAWALALSVCACARQGKGPSLLGNPGIVAEIWIPYWNWYNALMKGIGKDAPSEEPEEALSKNRRRIFTSAMAVLPEIREEDYD